MVSSKATTKLKSYGISTLEFALVGTIYALVSGATIFLFAEYFAIDASGDLTVFGSQLGTYDIVGAIFSTVGFIILGFYTLLMTFIYIKIKNSLAKSKQKNIKFKFTKKGFVISLIVVGLATSGLFTVINTFLVGYSPNTDLRYPLTVAELLLTNPLGAIASLLTLAVVGFTLVKVGTKAVSISNQVPKSAKVF